MNVLAARAGIKTAVVGKILGEPITGYEAPKGLGEFECENCRFYRASDSSCGQITMKRHSKQPRTDDGRIKVDAEGCCEFISRIGKVEPHEAEEEHAMD